LQMLAFKIKESKSFFEDHCHAAPFE